MRIRDDGSIEASPEENAELRALATGEPSALRRLIAHLTTENETLRSRLEAAETVCRAVQSEWGHWLTSMHSDWSLVVQSMAAWSEGCSKNVGENHE